MVESEGMIKKDNKTEKTEKTEGAKELKRVEEVRNIINGFFNSKKEKKKRQDNYFKSEIVKQDNKLKLIIDDNELDLGLLMAEFTEVTQGKSALRKDGNPTKEFSDWLKRREEFIYLQFIPHFNVKTVMRKFIERVALMISKSFNNYEINSAIDSEKGLGNDVHGFLELHFPEHYDWLIDNDVLYQAAYLARKNKEPSIITYTSGLKNLDKWIMTRFLLKVEENYKRFKKIKFKELIILSKKSLAESIAWNKKAIERIDEYPRVVEKGICNTALLAFTSRNIPVLIITYAPGKSEGVNDVYLDKKDANKAKDDIKDRTIRYLYSKLEPLENKLDSANRKILHLSRENAFLKYELEQDSIRSFDPKKATKKLELNELGEDNDNTGINWKNLIALIIAIALVGVIVFLVILNLNNMNQANATIETASTVLNTLKSMKSVI